jgi:D-amino-acid dehydrogenase
MGSAAAYHLAGEGMEALVFDRSHPGQATAAGAGILSGATTGGPGPAYWTLAERSDAYHRALAARRPAGSAGYGEVSLVLVAMPGDESRFHATRQRLVDRGAPVLDMDPTELKRLFPPVGDPVAALVHHHAARVDGRKLQEWFRESARERGARFAAGEVQRIVVEGGRVSGVVLASGDRVGADAAVVAAGAWSAPLLAGVGVEVRIAPQRGQIVHLDVFAAKGAPWPILEGLRGHYLLPWPDGRLVAGATRETGSGFDPWLSVSGQLEVLHEALRVAPGLMDARVREWRVGLRPASADGLPLLGPVASMPGLHVLTGHGAGGLLLGPYSAKLVVDVMAGREPGTDLTPFRPDRRASD